MLKGKMRLVALMLICSLIMSGCQSKEKDSGLNAARQQKSDGKLQVVTTIFPYYDFARQVAGEYADVTMIVPAGMDTHSFEPTAEDMVTIGQADVLIYNGGELEGWVPQVIEAAENENLFVDAMIDYVDADGEVDAEDTHSDEIHDADDNDDSLAEEIAEEKAEAQEERREDELEATRKINHDVDEYDDLTEEDTLSEHNAGDGHSHDDGDEHIWTSPENAKEIVEQIAKDLGKADEKHKEEYLKNAEKYIAEIDRIDQEIESVVDRANSRYLVFADRFPLRHFVEEYDLDYIAAFSGCGSETEPSAETIAHLTDIVKERQIPVILKIELTSSKVADSIAEASGAQVRTFSTCHNVTKEEMADGVTYVSLMEQNVAILKEALGVK